MYSYVKNPEHGWPTWRNEYVWSLVYFIQLAGFSYVIKRIWHSLTVVIKFIKLVLKKKCYQARQSLITFSKIRLIKILSQQLTQARSYTSMSQTWKKKFASPPVEWFRQSLELTLYYTIPTLKVPEKESFEKHCGKARIFSFSCNVFYHYQIKISFLTTFIVPSANSFNFDKSRILVRS